MEYNIFDPKVDCPLNDLSRQEAKVAYDWFISQINTRIEAITAYCEKQGFRLDGSATSLTYLHSFFVREVKKEIGDSIPSAYVFSLCNDIAIYMSEIIMRENRQIKWKMHGGGKKHIYYQRPVLSGFKNAKINDYCIDYDYLICQYAHRLLMGDTECDYFNVLYCAGVDVV